MCVCVHVFRQKWGVKKGVWICMHACVCAHIPLFVYVHVTECVCVCVFMHECASVCACTHHLLRAYLCACVCVCVFVSVSVCMPASPTLCVPVCCAPADGE